MKTHKVHYGRKAYRDEYLKSDEWKLVRSAVIAREGGVCRKCCLPKPLDAHHMDYAALGLPIERQLPLLVGLCRGCHDLVEDAKDVGLIPKTHTIQMLMSVSEEAISAFKRLMAQKIPWTAELTTKVERMSWRYQMRATHALGLYRHPGQFRVLEGRKFTRKKIAAVVKTLEVFATNPVIEKIPPSDLKKTKTRRCRKCKTERPRYDFPKGDLCRYC